MRTDVLVSVASKASATERLIETIDASESAIYNAVGDLERRGLVRTVDARHEVTGSGQLVADLLEQQENLSRLLEDDYWETHDVGALPRRFRLRLTELAGAEVFRAPDTDPHAGVREVSRRIEAAEERVDVVTPIYQAEYETVMPDTEGARLVIDTTVLRESLERVGSLEEARVFEETTVRLLDVDVGVGVTEDHLLFSLPTIDGQYDSRTEVLATDERALAWGRDLYEYYWERATPVDRFLESFEP
ncbi:MAG: transcriptional regulator FilR1 domain-containing protein [Haloarculaceae archaeon]